MNHPRPPASRQQQAPRRPRGAWLSLFAMLMIFIGPLISQAVPMNEHAGMVMPMSASMDMSAHEGHHAEGAQTSDIGAADHAIWAKCGYCTLLFSCPALPQGLAIIAPTPPKPADFYAAALQAGHAQRSVFPNARSRAPPSPLIG